MTALAARQAPQPSERESNSDLNPDGPFASMTLQGDGQKRVVISGVEPAIDGGRFEVKRVVGDEVKVGAHIFADGQGVLSAVIKYRHASEARWSEAPLVEKANDAWTGRFVVNRLGRYFYTVEAWIDEFGTWRRDLAKKFAAGQDVQLELAEGAILISRICQADPYLKKVASDLRSDAQSQEARVVIATEAEVEKRVAHLSPRAHASLYEHELWITVDPPLARFGAWYEFFPRSCAASRDTHGTFKDCERWLPRISEMGFDVVYLPPIHPIGMSFRKGRNGDISAARNDPGSPWAIGSPEGGHKSIHPMLGTISDFRDLTQKARALDLEVALDIAFQCSPDHPYVTEHPEWFRHRPDGSIHYAENPPKKYQDIYPFNFETESWPELWMELRSIFEFWVDQGVKVFRVDNPHTKPFAFWEWCLRSLKEKWPELIFLAEAFTRPKVMYHLAKIGFTQSYNYFPWRNTKRELQEFCSEVMTPPIRDYFRANLWPNTPDILTAELQQGGRPAFMARAILAATLGASYGIYGPAFECCENEAREPGSEEYLNSEKYEIRFWELGKGTPLADLLKRLNNIRRENPALQRDDLLKFVSTDNDHLLAYSKESTANDDLLLMVVNVDPHHTQSGWVQTPVEQWGFRPGESYECHDLLTDSRYRWSGSRNFVELNPHILPAHIFRIRRHSKGQPL